MELWIVIAVVVLALFVGATLGWLTGNRKGNLGAETAHHLRTQLDSVVAEREVAKSDLDAAKDKLARSETSLVERERSFEGQLRVLGEAKEALSAQFSEIGQKVLGDAQEQFLKRAEERFHQAGETNEAKLKLLLSPMDEALKSYRSQVEKVEKDRTEAYGDLKGLIGEMKQGQERVQTEAARIVSSLRTAPKTSGRWGEQQFENLLNLAGLNKGIDYKKEVSTTTDEGIFRPDFIINLPGNQQLIVDIKCPLDAYMEALGEDDPDTKKAHFVRHAIAVKGHAAALGKKSYWAQFEQAPDYVILYVPGDNFLSAALETDVKLWEDAAKNRVIVSGPATFFPLAKTIASMWRQNKLSEQAREIGQLGKEMYDRLAVAQEHMHKMGGSLERAVKQFNDFSGSFDRNIMSTGRKFAERNIETGKRAIEDVFQIDERPRYTDQNRPMITDERDAAE